MQIRNVGAHTMTRSLPRKRCFRSRAVSIAIVMAVNVQSYRPATAVTTQQNNVRRPGEEPDVLPYESNENPTWSDALDVLENYFPQPACERRSQRVGDATFPLTRSGLCNGRKAAARRRATRTSDGIEHNQQ